MTVTRPLALATALAASLLAFAPPTSAQSPVPISKSTQVITSFDGTALYSTLFLPAGASTAHPVPLVLRTHGWGGTGETSLSGTSQKLVDAGYAVLTWDERGFGQSGGEVHIDNPLYEGRDTSALIDWAEAHAPIARRGGKPIVGMTGGSYAGGIQTATAAFDSRIMAIAPEISWSDLRYSLTPGNVIKFGWNTLLYGAGNTALTGGVAGASGPAGLQTGRYTPDLDRAFVTGIQNNELDSYGKAFLAASSLDQYDAQRTRLTVPTLVMNGSVDTLFNLTDGYGVYEHAKAAGAPAKFIAFCGGHVSCPASYGDQRDREYLDKAILNWFDRYLKGRHVSTGPELSYRTNTHGFQAAKSFTSVQGGWGIAGKGSVVNVATPETLGAPGAGGTNAITTATVNQSGDPRAMTLGGPRAARATDLVGIPQVSLLVTPTLPGTTSLAPDGVRSVVNLFVKFVDRESGKVVDLQEGCARVDTTQGPTRATLRMPGLSYTLPAGHHLDVQVSTASNASLSARTSGSYTVSVRAVVPRR